MHLCVRNSLRISQQGGRLLTANALVISCSAQQPPSSSSSYSTSKAAWFSDAPEKLPEVKADSQTVLQYVVQRKKINEEVIKIGEIINGKQIEFEGSLSID